MDESPALVVVVPPAEIDVSTADAFAEDLYDAFETGAALVLVDFAFVLFCDAHGLQVLVRAVRLGRLHGGRLHIDSPSPQLLQLARLAGVAQTLGLI